MCSIYCDNTNIIFKELKINNKKNMNKLKFAS